MGIAIIGHYNNFDDTTIRRGRACSSHRSLATEWPLVVICFCDLRSQKGASRLVPYIARCFSL